MASSLKDRITWFSQVGALRQPMVAIIDVIQHLPGHFQIMVAGLAYYTLCKGAGLDYREVLTMIEKMERDIDAPYSNQFKAMKAYAAGELNE